jgi:hypothetical protein
MKYSLRSLMIGLTLFCVLLGGRIEYLRRMAAFHQREADRCASEFKALTGVHPTETFRLAGKFPGVLPLSQFEAHQTLASEYRNAVMRPWASIESPPPPTTEDEVWERVAKLVDKELGTKGNTYSP